MKKSFSFIEVLVSVTIASTVFIAIITLANQNLASAQLTRDRFLAANLAQEGIEIIANLRSNNWKIYSAQDSDFDTNNGGLLVNWRGQSGCQPTSVDYCIIVDGQYVANYDTVRLSAVGGGNDSMRKDNSGKYCQNGVGSCSGTLTPFRRVTTLTTINPHQLQVDVRITWTYNNLAQTVSAEDRLYNWR